MLISFSLCMLKVQVDYKPKSCFMYPEYKIKDEIKKTFFKKKNIISKKGRELK
jgi:hypothetical protein